MRYGPRGDANLAAATGSTGETRTHWERAKKDKELTGVCLVAAPSFIPGRRGHSYIERTIPSARI